MSDEPRTSFGPTAEAFLALEPEKRSAALATLDGIPHNSSARPAIAYLLAEMRGGLKNTVFLDALVEYAGDLGVPADLEEANLRNFLARVTTNAGRPLLSCCLLYAVHKLEADGEYGHVCLAYQRRIVAWASAVLRGENPGEAPSDEVAGDVASGSGSLGSTAQHAMQRFIGERIRHPMPDDELRRRLLGSEPIDQVSYLCLRSALNQPDQIIQSFLTILAPERSQTPFWTFAHFYVRNLHGDEDGEPQVKASGGVVLTTRTTLYLAGGEGWLGDSSTIHERSIYEDLKADTLTAFAFPIQDIGGMVPMLAGLAMTSNVADKPIVGRVALRPVTVRDHHKVVGTVKVNGLPGRLRELYNDGVIKRRTSQNKGKSAAAPSDKSLEEEARGLVAAINNTATFEFMEAREKSPPGHIRNTEYFMHRIREIFQTQGNAVHATVDGEDYTFEKHRWTHMVGWKT